MIANLLLTSSKFHCVEAIEYNHEIAKKNVNLNNLEKKRFKLYNYAVSDKNETFFFSINLKI